MLYKQVLGVQTDPGISTPRHTGSGFGVLHGSLKPNGPEDIQDARFQFQWLAQSDDCL
jgi:hypothetical protein